MSRILILLVPVLIAADLATGRRHSHGAVLVNVVAAAGLPLLLLTGLLRPAAGALFLLWQYLCLRLMTLHYGYLRGSDGSVGPAGGAGLAGYAVLWDLLTLALALSVAAWVAIAVSMAGHTVFYDLLTRVLGTVVQAWMVIALSVVGGACAYGTFAELPAALVAQGLVVPVSLAAGFLLLFVSVPAVLGLRALFGCRRALGLSHAERAGYVLLLLTPQVNLVPLLLLRRRCREAAGRERI